MERKESAAQHTPPRRGHDGKSAPRMADIQDKDKEKPLPPRRQNVRMSGQKWLGHVESGIRDVLDFPTETLES